jgi:hypothetical protein
MDGIAEGSSAATSSRRSTSGIPASMHLVVNDSPVSSALTATVAW